MVASVTNSDKSIRPQEGLDYDGRVMAEFLKQCSLKGKKKVSFVTLSNKRNFLLPF